MCMHVRTQAAEAKRQSEEERKRKTEEAKRKAAAEEARKAAELKRQQEEDKRKQEEEDERKQEAALNQLAEMGFTDRSGNKKLLEQSRNDVATVVDRLFQDASTAQRGVIQGGRGGAGESGGGRGACLEQGRSYVDTSRKLGSGSAGDVVGGKFRFPGQQQDTQVAFKIFRGGGNLTGVMSEKIKKEIELGMQLLHPNLVRLFGMLNHDEHGPVLVL